MITKKFTYVDFRGTERTESADFHFSTEEVITMESSKNGGLMEWMKKAISTNNTEELMPVFRDVILKSYGEISPDGRRFVKSPELSKAFSETPMFTMLIESFFEDSKNAAEFFKGVGMAVEKKRTAPKLEDAIAAAGGSDGGNTGT